MKRVSDAQKKRNADKAKESKALHELFREIWDEREDEGGYVYCYESGLPMHGSKFRSNTCCYDHVLEKSSSSYPDYKFVKMNIIIVHPDVHAQKGRDINKCPRIKELREKLISLHEEGKLYD